MLLFFMKRIGVKKLVKVNFVVQVGICSHLLLERRLRKSNLDLSVQEKKKIYFKKRSKVNLEKMRKIFVVFLILNTNLKRY